MKTAVGALAALVLVAAPAASAATFCEGLNAAIAAASEKPQPFASLAEGPLPAPNADMGLVAKGKQFPGIGQGSCLIRSPGATSLRYGSAPFHDVGCTFTTGDDSNAEQASVLKDNRKTVSGWVTQCLAGWTSTLDVTVDDPKGSQTVTSTWKSKTSPAIVEMLGQGAPKTPLMPAFGRTWTLSLIVKTPI